MSHVVCIVYSLLSIIQDGETALIWASYRGHTEVVKVLAEAKADLNITDQVNFIINYLLTLTIDVYYDYCFIFISLQDGDTALIDAVSKGHTSTVNILLDRGAATDIRNKVTDILLYTSHKPVQKEIVWKLLNTYYRLLAPNQ